MSVWLNNAYETITTGNTACGVETRVPYGYRVSAGRLVFDTRAARSVRQIFLMSADGLSIRAIARRVGASQAFVRKSLDNPLYLGGRVGAPSAHPSLISESLWARAHRDRANNG